MVQYLPFKHRLTDIFEGQTIAHHEYNLKVMIQSVMDNSHCVKDFLNKYDILTKVEETQVNHISVLKKTRGIIYKDCNQLMPENLQHVE